MLPNQYGFRPNRSTTHATYVLKSIIQRSRQKGTHLWVTYFDITKAYDAVNRDKLWQISKEVGYGDRILAILKQLYVKNSHVFKWPNLEARVKVEYLLWVKSVKVILKLQ